MQSVYLVFSTIVWNELASNQNLSDCMLANKQKNYSFIIAMNLDWKRAKIWTN